VSAALSSASQAPDKIPYAIQRYFDESLRLISVLDRRLSEHTYLADEYRIQAWAWGRGRPSGKFRGATPTVNV
jgi:hypothetical protein